MPKWAYFNIASIATGWAIYMYIRMRLTQDERDRLMDRIQQYEHIRTAWITEHPVLDEIWGVETKDYTDDTDENNLVTICNCGQCPTSATETLRVLEDFAHWCSINRYDSEVAADELHSLMEEVEDLIDRIRRTLHLNIEDDTTIKE